MVSTASANNLLATGGNSGVTNGGSNDNQVGVADPGLDTGLANNGGPTQTIALLSNSPAVDAGNSLLDGGQMTDQRGAGFPRVVGANVDIGAFELQTAATSNPAPTLEHDPARPDRGRLREPDHADRERLGLYQCSRSSTGTPPRWRRPTCRRPK